MKSLATLLLSSSLLVFAACGGDDAPADPDAETGDMPDAEVSPPDADNSCTTDTACVGQTAGDTVCAGNAVVTCTAAGDCLDAVTTTPCTGTDSCVDDGTPACEAPACITDPECLGQTDGETLCVGNSLVSCAANGACLDATATACTNTDVCVNDGTPACQANGDGEACVTAQYIAADVVISGADFGADYTDEQDWTGAGCAQGNVADANVEGVFAVNLSAYQRLTVNETGGMAAIMGIQQTCGNTEACLASDATSPESVTYFAAEPTTLFVYVGAVAQPPVTTAYSIAFVFTTCGDGAVATTEQCDDGDNLDGDGCSAVCEVEFGWGCDEASPSVCTVFDDLGSHGGGDTITETTTDPVAAQAATFYTVTFTEPVHLTGTITAAGDADFYVFSSNGLLYQSEDVNATTETFGDDFDWYLTPGTYVVAVYAYTALATGYTLTMNTVAPPHTDLGTFAPGAAIANATGGAITANDAVYYTITFSAPVLLDGTLGTTTTGDLDLYMWEPGNPIFSSSANGAETWTDLALPAGTYYLELYAYAATTPVNVDGYTLTLATTAP